MISQAITPGFCGHISNMSFGFPNYETLLLNCFGWTICLTVQFSGKNSNLTRKKQKELHNDRVDSIKHIDSRVLGKI